MELPRAQAAHNRFELTFSRHERAVGRRCFWRPFERVVKDTHAYRGDPVCERISCSSIVSITRVILAGEFQLQD